MGFQTQHISMLAKYAGISFIAGSVNHGMFSEQRSLWTAALGVVFFLIGGWLEMRLSDQGSKRWVDLLGFGIVASVGLGFFTGGLQHFPDSPERSVWVVPLGFFLSLLALYFTDGRGKIPLRQVTGYGTVAGAAVVAASVAAMLALPAPSSDHASGQDHNHAHPVNADLPAISAGTQGALAVTGTPNVTAAHVRELVITMDDTMRFTPSNWQAVAGEKIRIKVVNNGKLRHELVLGNAAELAEHAKMMKAPNAAQHHHDNAIAVEPGQQGELVWTFKTAGAYGMACFEPGHFEAGMKGDITVATKG